VIIKGLSATPVVDSGQAGESRRGGGSAFTARPCRHPRLPLWYRH